MLFHISTNYNMWTKCNALFPFFKNNNDPNCSLMYKILWNYQWIQFALTGWHGIKKLGHLNSTCGMKYIIASYSMTHMIEPFDHRRSEPAE